MPLNKKPAAAAPVGIAADDEPINVLPMKYADVMEYIFEFSCDFEENGKGKIAVEIKKQSLKDRIFDEIILPDDLEDEDDENFHLIGSLLISVGFHKGLAFSESGQISNMVLWEVTPGLIIFHLGCTTQNIIQQRECEFQLIAFNHFEVISIEGWE